MTNEEIYKLRALGLTEEQIEGVSTIIEPKVKTISNLSGQVLTSKYNAEKAAIARQRSESESKKNKQTLNNVKKELTHVKNYAKKLAIKCESLSEEKSSLLDKVNELTKELIEIKEKYETLKTNVNNNTIKDALNSGVSPSNSKRKKIHNNNPQSTGKPKGARKGHKGKNLKRLQPTETIRIESIKNCPICGAKMKVIEEKIKQLIDLVTELKVTDHIIEVGKCPSCGYVYKPEILNRLVNDVTYSDEIKSYAILFMEFGNISIERSIEIFRILTRGELNISPGTMCNFKKLAAQKGKKIRDQLFIDALSRNYNCLDTTYVKNEGKQNYIETIANEYETILYAMENKKAENYDRFPFYSLYKNVLVHDHNKAYYKFGGAHQECLAHILRYLMGVIEIEGKGWAEDMHKLLTGIIHRAKELIEKGELSFSEEEYQKYSKMYDTILSEGSKTYEGENKYNNDAINLLKRLVEYKESTLYFMHHLEIPFTNNESERSLRMSKTKQKVSGQWNSFDSLEYFAIIRTVIQTSQKRNINVFDAIKSLFNDENLFY